MNLQQRIETLARLGTYMLSADEEWIAAKEKAGQANNWFTPEFVELSTRQIAGQFLQKEIVEHWVAQYHLPAKNENPQLVGIVMAGNIPLVGFHDLLCVFISGNKALVKPSSKDEVLIKHLVAIMQNWEPDIENLIRFSEMLKGCDAYIATGSNNSAGYFDYYFGKYPHLIRRNRTSVAVLTGEESREELDLLADDVYLYFGLGCRNVTKLYVPEGYDFEPLLRSFDRYNYLSDHHKLKNNYDYNLALHLLNKKYYMSNPSILLIEDASLFSPISQLNYEYYTDREKVLEELHTSTSVQCIVGKNETEFGKAQQPGIMEYADGADTMTFLAGLSGNFPGNTLNSTR